MSHADHDDRFGDPDGVELSVTVPLYNEQENVASLYDRITATCSGLGITYEILFVNDGSRDDTAALIDAIHDRDPRVIALHLSRNFGHQAALSAGLDHARGQAVTVMDGDLQDPPEVIPLFLERWRQGYDVVYAIRQNRQEGLFKRIGYLVFYRLLRAISELDVPLDAGDFSLMDRRVVEALRGLPERTRFVRGLRSFVGFRQIGLAYDRAAREAGRPKYTLRSLLGLAVDGLVSFSSYPLRMVTYLGLTAATIALALTIWAFADALYNRATPRGWASLVIVVLVMGSVQLISLGIIGEYIRLIFMETKRRPTYVVRECRRRPAGPAETPAANRNGVAHDPDPGPSPFPRPDRRR